MSKHWPTWLRRSGNALLCASLLSLAACRPGSGGPQTGPAPSAPPQQGQQQGAAQPEKDPVQEVLGQMSLEEKLGQMIFAGFDGVEVNEHTRQLIQTNHVGGFILYKPNIQNVNQLVGLLNAMKQTNAGSKLPLWLGVDEEGGRVTRLPEAIVKTPASRVIGKTASPDFAYGIGSVLGRELHAFGLNVDFAPVLDVNSNPDNPVIGDRSFGSTAPLVSSMGVQTMKGLQKEQVLPVVKHFPGHGDTSVDSHIGLPVVQNDLTRLRKLELIPFAEAIKQQADAVMVAHILLPKVDAKVPASMSKEIMTNLLRNEMGFDGVIMTDDMTMGAIIENYKLGEAAVQSVLAGANVIMVGHEFEKVTAVMDALLQAVHDKRLPQETIDESVKRIVKLKQKYHIADTAVAVPDTVQLNTAVQHLLDTYQK